MGQHFLLQNLSGVLDTLLFGHPGPGTSGTNEVQGHSLFLYDKRFIQWRLHLQRPKEKLSKSVLSLSMPGLKVLRLWIEVFGLQATSQKAAENEI